MNSIKRCEWVKDDFDADYHDNEWCIPCHDDKMLFELLILEGMQAGLTWNLVLKRRENMRKAFDNFNYNKIACYNSEKIESLLLNPDIIRNKAKINALISNAKAFIKVQQEFGSFDKFLWNFSDGKVIYGHWQTSNQTPVENELSQALSKELKKRGFKYVGPVICYSYMQAAGLFNDHTVDCSFYSGNNI